MPSASASQRLSQAHGHEAREHADSRACATGASSRTSRPGTSPARPTAPGRNQVPGTGIVHSIAVTDQTIGRHADQWISWLVGLRWSLEYWSSNGRWASTAVAHGRFSGSRRVGRLPCDQSTEMPASRCSASAYLARVACDHLGRHARAGRGLVPVQRLQVVAHELLVVARRADARPRTESAGQKRDESGVSISSITCSTPSSSRPNSSLVSAMMMPRCAA